MDATLRIESPADQPIYVVQLTDAHLGKQAGTALLGVDTDHSLDHVLQMVQQGEAPAVLLCTGDLSNDGSIEAYQRFQQTVSCIDAPQVWLPGNHDERLRMAAALGSESPLLSRLVHVGNWTIIMLDSSVAGKVGGTLSDEEMALLDQALKDNTDRHILVCLHHHILPVNCHWLDSQRVTNSNQLMMLLEHYPNVKAVLSGHVHQEFQARYAQFDVLTTPSTCIQFAPQSHDFKVDQINPGYRWFRFHPDGQYETGVERVQGVSFPVDMKASGY